MILRLRPNIVGVQIGINDFMHVDSLASNASTIAEIYTRIIDTVRGTLGSSTHLYMCTISVDGEEIDNKNHDI